VTERSPRTTLHGLFYRPRRRLELARELRRDPGHPWRWCWYYAGFVMRMAHEIATQPPLTEAELFELDVLSDICALPEVTGAGLAA
jgi:hypothetical protein